MILTDVLDLLRVERQVTRPTQYRYLVVRDRLQLKSGLSLSVQLGLGMYCTPRENLDRAADYLAAEVGYPTESVPELLEYADDPDYPIETVYGYVPMTVLAQIYEKHGGLCPTQQITLRKRKKLNG